VYAGNSLMVKRLLLPGSRARLPMRVVVAGQVAGVGGAGIGDRAGAIRRHHIEIKVHQPLAGNAPVHGSHSMRRMAGGAGKAVVDVPGVFAEGRVCGDVCQIMAFSAQGVWPVDAKIRSGKQVCNQLPWKGGLAELVAPLQDVRPLRAMRTIRTCATELAIVVAIVAIGTKDSRAHGAPARDAVEVQHVCQQTGLRQRAVAVVGHGMAGGRSGGKLRDYVEWVARRYCPHRKVSVDRFDLLTRAGTVTAQAILELIHSWVDHAGSIHRADPGDVLLGNADRRGRWKYANLFGTVSVMTVDAGRVAIVVE